MCTCFELPSVNQKSYGHEMFNDLLPECYLECWICEVISVVIAVSDRRNH